QSFSESTLAQPELHFLTVLSARLEQRHGAPPALLGLDVPFPDDWRNDEEERPNGWLSERRKPYLKTGDRISPRMGPGDERGRDWYPRGSPQGSSFSSYHSIDDFYKKDSMYKTDKLSRPQHQRHEGKTKRREGGDYHRPRHSDTNRTAEDRGRSKRPSRRQDKEEK
ncbi:hypothetical protein M9458_043508, partial [Cirrhinus mrigala]